MDTDLEARELVIREATRKGHLETARSARRTLPLGVTVITAGIAITTAAVVVPLGIVAQSLIGIGGLIMIPLGIALVGRALAALLQARRMLRELEPPRAVVIDRS